MEYESILESLKQTGNYRQLPNASHPGILDFSTNDYLGLAQRRELTEYFIQQPSISELPMSSSASRLLSSCQKEFEALENRLSELYDGKAALLFNSGYHANTGLLSALADRHTLVIADRLVHASMIDGILLSRAHHERFRHNDYDHLEKILSSKGQNHEHIIIAVESIYSMDGDKADIDRLIGIKQKHKNAILYVDEAHAFGVRGDNGLGFSKSSSDFKSVDVVVGTFGKAGASVGAFAVMSPTLKEFAINRSRSFIFSTALPPLNVAWSHFMLDKIVTMNEERIHLLTLARYLQSELQPLTNHEIPISHIQPLIVGDSEKAVQLSRDLLKRNIKVLPIRTPTVPPGTERLRISLSAAMTKEDVTNLVKALKQLI